MRPLEVLETAATADGGRLRLLRRDGDYFIQLDGEQLMSTRATGSESALAALGCSRVAGLRPRLLIGGLGFGYTLRKALDLLPPQAEVVVAEISSSVIAWNRSYLADLQGGAMEDPRVRFVERDVSWPLFEEPGRRPYDAILLDVDNGPQALCLKSNERLYSHEALTRIRGGMLTASGVLAVWSSSPDPAFVQRLSNSGFKVRAETARSNGRKGHRHTIFLASR